MSAESLAKHLTAEELELFESNIDINTNGDEWATVAAASLIKEHEQL